MKGKLLSPPFLWSSSTFYPLTSIRHRWDAEQKKWIKQDNMRFAAGTLAAGHGSETAPPKSPGAAVPHTPRSLLDDGEELNQKSVVERLKRLL
jgi:hypothetical protein